MKKENYRMRVLRYKHCTKDYVMQSADDVYFTCKYYGMTWNERYPESLKYDTMSEDFKTRKHSLMIHRL